MKGIISLLVGLFLGGVLVASAQAELYWDLSGRAKQIALQDDIQVIWKVRRIGITSDRMEAVIEREGKREFLRIPQNAENYRDFAILAEGDLVKFTVFQAGDNKVKNEVSAYLMPARVIVREY